jgi:hypothetical protein
LLYWIVPAGAGRLRLRKFVVGALAIGAVGLLLSALSHWWPEQAAWLLRFYWFRLSDVAVPLGMAFVLIEAAECLGAGAAAALPRSNRVRLTKAALIGVALVAAVHIGWLVQLRVVARPPRADPDPRFYDSWRFALQWINDSGEIPANARFLTPRMAHTFKWYTGRSEVVNWKEIPQDARSVVEWWQRISEIHGRPDPAADPWYHSLAQRSNYRLGQLAREYDADYILCYRWPRMLTFERVYQNRRFVIYRVDRQGNE